MEKAGKMHAASQNIRQRMPSNSSPVLQQGTNGAKVMSAIDANSEAILTQSLFTETALVWWI